MAKKSTHHKRFIFMFLFTALFGVVSWLYFYFSFFNFFTFDEDHYIIDAQQNTIYISSRSQSARIPKKGIKINVAKYTFDDYSSTLEVGQNYNLHFKNQHYVLKVVNRPIIALHIIGFDQGQSEQEMRWELKQPTIPEKSGYGRLLKSHFLLEEKDLELRFYNDSLLSRPSEIGIFDSVFTGFNLISVDHELYNVEKENKPSALLFINGELYGDFWID